MDKAAIFTTLTQRNALRKQAKLPLLDLTSEYHNGVALAAWQACQAACDRFAGARARIRDQVLADFRAVHGPGFGFTFGGRWAVGHETNRRFQLYMREIHGLQFPESTSPNSIVYGGANTTREV